MKKQWRALWLWLIPGAFVFFVGAVLAQTAVAADVCPITKCDYSDPQYQASFAQFARCAGQFGENFEKFMRTLGLFHPRFGVAWAAYEDETKAAMRPDGTTDEAALQAAKQRFDDRILRTAEPEAVDWYNLYMQKMRADPMPCGEIPQPPRKQPQP